MSHKECCTKFQLKENIFILTGRKKPKKRWPDKKISKLVHIYQLQQQDEDEEEEERKKDTHSTKILRACPFCSLVNTRSDFLNNHAFKDVEKLSRGNVYVSPKCANYDTAYEFFTKNKIDFPARDTFKLELMTINGETKQSHERSHDFLNKVLELAKQNNLENDKIIADIRAYFSEDTRKIMVQQKTLERKRTNKEQQEKLGN